MSGSGSIRIIDMPDLGAPTDTSSVVGEKSGSGRFGIAALNTYLGGKFLPLAGGTLTGPLNVQGYTGANQVFIGPWTETSTTGPYGTDLLIQRTYNVAGGLQQFVNSINVQTTIEGAPAIFINPIGQFTTLRTSGADGGLTPAGEPTGQHVGIESAMMRELGPSIAFMYHGQSIDSTGLVQDHTVTFGMELDIQANGPENPITSYYPGAGARGFISLGPTCYPAPSWQPNHAYVLGNAVQPTTPNGFVYAVQVAGTSGSVQPTWPTAVEGVVTDGSVTWQYGTTHAMQVSRGISFGGDANSSYGAGIFVDNSAHFYDAMIDLSHGVLLDGGVKDAAIRLNAEMPIDFSANGTDAGQNVRTLRWTTGHELVYRVSGTDMFTVSDAGELSAGGPRSPGFQIDLRGTNVVGLYTGNGTFSGSAIRLGTGQQISLTSADSDGVRYTAGKGVSVYHSTGTPTDVAWIDSAGRGFFGSLQLNAIGTSYANDAAAATGGVAIGGIYRNGSALQIRVA